MQEIEGHKGLYHMEHVADMPYGPEEIWVLPYELAGQLSNWEQDEAAARLIIACQEAGIWCGVSSQWFLETIRQETSQYREAQREEQKDREYYHREVRKYILFSILTLGVYALIIKGPRRPFPRPRPALITGVYDYGPPHVCDGLVQLAYENLITVEKNGDGHNVYFPTTELLFALDGLRHTPAQ
jgi:hypothetical protein